MAWHQSCATAEIQTHFAIAVMMRNEIHPSYSTATHLQMKEKHFLALQHFKLHFD